MSTFVCNFIHSWEEKTKINFFIKLINVNWMPVIYYSCVLTNNEEYVWIKYHLIFSFVVGDACVEQERNRRENSCTQRNRWESELPAETDLSQNSRLYIVLKLAHDLHAMIVFYWSRLTPMHCLLFLGQGLHPRNACISLTMVYTHAMLVLHW